MIKCAGCDKDFRAEDTAPFQRNVDGTFAEACRHCITEWIAQGHLWPIPFWRRKQEV